MLNQSLAYNPVQVVQSWVRAGPGTSCLQCANER